MAPLKALLFALAAASPASTCDGDDSVCLLQLKETKAETNNAVVQSTKTKTTHDQGPCKHEDGSFFSEFECYQHALCYWTPDDDMMPCTACSICLGEHPSDEGEIVCGCGVCGRMHNHAESCLAQECLSWAEDNPNGHNVGGTDADGVSCTDMHDYDEK